MKKNKVNIELDLEDLLGLKEPSKNSLEYDLLFIMDNGIDEYRKLREITYKDVLDDIFANYDCKGDLEKSKEIKDFLESHIGQLNDKVWFSMPGFEIIIPRLFLTKNKKNT